MAISFSNTKQEIDLDDLVTFGKYSGFRWSYVVEDQPDYVIWCVGNTDNNFSKDVIVAAIKSKYKKKKESTTHEQDRDNEANAWKFNNKPTYPSSRTSYFYDGGLHGDMAHFTMSQIDGVVQDGSEDWDDDVPF